MGFVNKKKYLSPQVETVLLTIEDILNGSDVLIDGSELFGETQN